MSAWATAGAGALRPSGLRVAGFFRQGFDRDIRILYRDILARAALSEPEAHRVERCFGVLRALIERMARHDGTTPGD